MKHYWRQEPFIHYSCHSFDLDNLHKISENNISLNLSELFKNNFTNKELYLIKDIFNVSCSNFNIKINLHSKKDLLTLLRVDKEIKYDNNSSYINHTILKDNYCFKFFRI